MLPANPTLYAIGGRPVILISKTRIDLRLRIDDLRLWLSVRPRAVWRRFVVIAVLQSVEMK